MVVVEKIETAVGDMVADMDEVGVLEGNVHELEITVRHALARLENSRAAK